MDSQKFNSSKVSGYTVSPQLCIRITVYWVIFKVLNFRNFHVSCACHKNYFHESVETPLAPLYMSTWVIRENNFSQKFNFDKMQKFSTSKIIQYTGV